MILRYWKLTRIRGKQLSSKGNYRDVHKETKLVETTGTKLDLKSEKGTFF